jgi:amidase
VDPTARPSDLAVGSVDRVDLAFATTTELTGALARREVSSRELLDHLLDRVARYNPALNAVVALDAERAYAAAGAADTATAQGGPTGPLHGLPMTVKDVWETEGLVTTAGAPELAHHVPTTDALAVGRLKDAGAIIFGKTNTPLYAGDFQTYNDVYGRTNNPWDPTRTVGGSSGGSAAAVASAMSPLELGSDIGGSIRMPAHFNGIYGLKPSWGVVPSRGHIPGPPGSLVETDVNCNGPLARSLADLALALDVLNGPVPEEAAAWRLELSEGPPIEDVRGLRVATVFEEGADVLPVGAEVRTRLAAFAARLAEAGASVEATALPVALADGYRSWQDLVIPIMASGQSDEDFTALRPFEDLDGDDWVSGAGRALVSRYRTWAQANGRRQHQRAAWAAFFARYDAVLAPVFSTAAFLHDTEAPLAVRTVDVDGVTVSAVVASAWCGAIGSALLPVVTLPVGPGASGLPVGVQVIGPFLSDRRLLRIAGLLDQAGGPGFVAPPLPGAP